MDYLWVIDRSEIAPVYIGLFFGSGSSRPKWRNVTGRKSKINGRVEAIAGRSSQDVTCQGGKRIATCFFIGVSLKKKKISNSPRDELTGADICLLISLGFRIPLYLHAFKVSFVEARENKKKSNLNVPRCGCVETCLETRDTTSLRYTRLRYN